MISYFQIAELVMYVYGDILYFNKEIIIAIAFFLIYINFGKPKERCNTLSDFGLRASSFSARCWLPDLIWVIHDKWKRWKVSVNWQKGIFLAYFSSFVSSYTEWYYIRNIDGTAWESWYKRHPRSIKYVYLLGNLPSCFHLPRLLESIKI